MLVNIVTCFMVTPVIGDVKAVNKSISSAKEKWEKIGTGLGLSHNTLQQIGATHQGDPAKCLYATINAWLRREDKSSAKGVTWRTLIRTLKTADVGEPHLAERLMQEKGEGTYPSPCELYLGP